MRHMKPITAQLALYLGVFLACVALAAVPACGADQRTKTLRASIVSVNAARDGFVAWDRAHEHTIVEHATTREEAEAGVAAYRVKSATVWTGLELAYHAIVLAVAKTDDMSLRDALAEAGKVLALIKTFTGGS